MAETITVHTMLVNETGKLHRVLGDLELPHVPQIGSHILAHPIDAPEDGIGSEEHIYEVVDVRYQVGRYGAPSRVRKLMGWEILLKDRGSHLKFRLDV
jgi:hypothetical protein